MRILFIPNAGAVIPHLVPLMALDSRIQARPHETAFLLPSRLHEPMRALCSRVLDIDYRAESAFRDEMAACGSFRPDIIVDDFSMVALLTASVTETPRITIARTGVFPGGVPMNASHRHSCESLGEGRFDFVGNYGGWESFFGVRAPRDFAELSDASVSIIPGIPTIEVLPAAASDIRGYHFAGTLGVPDRVMATLHDHGVQTKPIIEQFLAKHHARQTALFTLGSVMASRHAIQSCIIQMLESGISVISTIATGELAPHLSEMFLHVPRVPMDEVCSRVDMMVHHCGSGTYQYAINHRLPSICIGSGFYDRDDVAQRLAGLGVAAYLPFEEHDRDFAESFRQALSHVGSDGAWAEHARMKLDSLKRENDRVSVAFDVEAVLQEARVPRTQHLAEADIDM